MGGCGGLEMADGDNSTLRGCCGLKELIFNTAESLQLCYTNHPVVVIDIVWHLHHHGQMLTK